MGMSLDAYLFYGRPAKPEGGTDLPDSVWQLKNELTARDIDYIYTGSSDYQEPAIVIKSTLVSAYYSPKVVLAETRSAITNPLWRGMADRKLSEAFELLGLDDTQFEPANWYIAPSHS